MMLPIISSKPWLSHTLPKYRLASLNQVEPFHDVGSKLKIFFLTGFGHWLIQISDSIPTLEHGCQFPLLGQNGQNDQNENKWFAAWVSTSSAKALPTWLHSLLAV